MSDRGLALVEPPQDYEGLKRFILEQLRAFSSLADWYPEQIAKLERQSPGEIIGERITEAEQSLTYAEEEDRKADARVRRAQEWLAELRASLRTTGET